MAREVFNRYERKFVLRQVDAEALEHRLIEFMNPDPHCGQDGSYTISNIYYDTRDSTLIRASLAKPVYKEKLRLRAYGVPALDSRVFLEIKKKLRGRVNKRRTTLRLDDAYEFVTSRIRPEAGEGANEQIIREIDYFLASHELVPQLYLAYDRRAFAGDGDSDLRITFDANIRTRRTDLRLESGDHGRRVLDSDQVIMEIKTPRNLPLWLGRMLSEQGIFRRSFSKYGAEYRSRVAERAAGVGDTRSVGDTHGIGDTHGVGHYRGAAGAHIKELSHA